MSYELIGVVIALIGLFGVITRSLVQSRRDALDAYHNLAGDLEARLERTEAKLTKAEAKADKLEAQIDLLNKEIERLMREMSAKDQEIERLKLEIADLRRMQDQDKLKIAELEQKLAVTERANAVLKDRNDELYEYISQLREAIKGLGGTPPKMLKH